MIEFLLTSSILIIAVILLRMVFQKKIRAIVQYALWLLVLARLLLPFGLGESPWSILTVLGASPPESQAQPMEAAGVPPQESAAAQPGDSSPTNPAIIAPGSTELSSPPQAGGIDAVPAKVPLRTILLCAWGAGAMLLGCWFLHINMRFTRALRREAARLDQDFSRLPVYLVRGLPSPCLVGFARPSIYLSESVLDDEDALRYGITHELCHYAHGDHIWAFLRILCVTVYWFHPLVWAAASLSKQDCEIACDEAVIKRLGESQRIAYGNTLLKLLATRPGGSLPRYAATTMASGGAQLRTRIKCISSPRQTRLPSVAVLTIICLFLVSCTMTSPMQITMEAQPSATPAQYTASAAPSIPPAGSLATPAPRYAGAPSGAQISSAETLYKMSEENALIRNRTANIEKAAGLLNGYVLQPGETFSFNEAIGPRLAENGWKEATCVVENTYATAPGGGIDQVSTTLYNAVLRANLPIVERKAHSTPSDYVSLGLDATVDDGYLDLKFSNATDSILTIAAQTLPDSAHDTRAILRISLYGQALSGGISYQLRSVVISETDPPDQVIYQDDPTLPAGMEAPLSFPRGGYEAQVYRDTYQNDTLTGSALLYTDTYKSSPHIIRRGTKPPHPLSDMQQEELQALAPVVFGYRYKSAAHSFDEINQHYSALFRVLEIDCGGLMNEGAGVSFTIGVPMEKFELEKCYPYAAILFALDPDVGHMDIGSMAYDRTGKDSLSLTREAVEAHYKANLDQPLLAYAKSESLLLSLLLQITGHADSA